MISLSDNTPNARNTMNNGTSCRTLGINTLKYSLCFIIVSVSFFITRRIARVRFGLLSSLDIERTSTL